MRLTVHMIIDRLGDCLAETRIPPASTFSYEMARVLLPEESCLAPGLAYVLDPRRLAELPPPAADNLLILTDDPAIPLSCPVLICRGSIKAVFEAVSAVFAQYRAVEEVLKEALLDDWDLSRMLDPLARFLRNPVQVYAPIFKAVASVRPVFGKEGQVSGTENYEQIMTAEEVHCMLANNDLRDIVKIRHAQYYRYPVFNCACYQVNLVSHDKLVGRLVLIEESEPFTAGIADTLNAVAGFIRHHMVHRRSAKSSSLFTVEYSITEILSGRISDLRIIASLTSALAWPARDSFAILYFSSPAQDLSTKDLTEFHVQALGDLMPTAVVLTVDDGIAAVFRTRLQPLAALEKQLEPYLATSDIYAGLSESFGDFVEARSAFLQARAAVRLGLDARQAGRIFHYQDNAVDHIISIAIESGYGATFIHPAIARLEKHDKENQTDLLATLRTYLQTQCNQVASAERLHIHRNSMKYRLQQINEIIGFDLRNTSQHLRLLLSILIHDRL